MVSTAQGGSEEEKKKVMENISEELTLESPEEKASRKPKEPEIGSFERAMAAFGGMF